MPRQDMDGSKGPDAANWELLLQEQQGRGTAWCQQEPNQRVGTESTSGTLIFKALRWAVLWAGLRTVLVFCQSFLQRRITTSLFLVTRILVRGLESSYDEGQSRGVRGISAVALGYVAIRHLIQPP